MSFINDSSILFVFDKMDLVDLMADYFEDQNEAIKESEQTDWKPIKTKNNNND